MIAPSCWSISADFEPVTPGICTSCMGAPLATVVSASVATALDPDCVSDMDVWEKNLHDQVREAGGLARHFPWLVVCMSEVLANFPTPDTAKEYADDCNTCSECGMVRR